MLDRLQLGTPQTSMLDRLQNASSVPQNSDENRPPKVTVGKKENIHNTNVKSD